MHVRILK